MSDPFSALIGAGGSILGGLLGGSKKITAGDNAYSHVRGIMKASKQFGFNPLTLLGAVSPMGGTPADNSALGQGIANAALIASDAVSAKRQTAARLNAYQTQNARLQKRLEALTIRSPVPGVYGVARQPSDPEVYGDDEGNPLHDPVKLDRGSGGGIAVPDPRLDRGSGGYGHGFRLEPAPGYSPASVIEEEYGDVASWGYGLVKVGADVGYNARRFTDYMGWTPPGKNLGPYWADKASRGYTTARQWASENLDKNPNNGTRLKWGAYPGWMDGFLGKGHVQ